MEQVSFTLIFRSWWRNKTFAVISILSLAVGIACTNLLAAFVMHEYNVEAGNPNREHILCLVQDSPMQSGEKVFYAGADIPGMLKDRYPEVNESLRLGTHRMSHIQIGEEKYESITLLQADTTFSRFFPYEVIAGDLQEALREPNKVALTEEAARRFFGKTDPIGQTFYAHHPEGTPAGEKGVTLQVVALLKNRTQSFLSFEGIMAMPSSYWGGVSFLLMNQAVDKEALALRLKQDGIPTLQGEIGQYHLYSLQENYFQSYTSQTLTYINQQHKPLLYVGFFSAILILLIACFNYINLNFSRLLQQMRMIHIQELMGAGRKEINGQLFMDTFLTVGIAFLLSLLVTHDLLPFFNSIVSGRMPASFFFSSQVFPLLCGFALILSVIPAFYMSRKVTSLSHQNYRAFHSGGRRKGIISLLSIAQFVVSIVLIMATLTVNRQVDLIRQGGESYRGIIEMSNPAEDMQAFVNELRSRPELGEITTTGSSPLNSWVRQVIQTDEQGQESYYRLLMFTGNPNMLKTFHLELLQGLTPEEALARYPRPAYINERYAELLVGEGENPVGKPLKTYDKDAMDGLPGDRSGDNSSAVIAGVVSNLYTGSLEEEVDLSVLYLGSDEQTALYHTVCFRLDPNQPQRLDIARRIWEKHNPGKLFTYRELYEVFLSRNQKTLGLVRLLMMYSLISLFLTCFGLFGMALYALEQRTKEIGIRKVNGASTFEILFLFNFQFIRWVAIAFVIALPIVWILLNRWLESFAYRVEIAFGTCLLAGLIVLFITLLTVSWHGYKAASGNPVAALKSE